jgi:hypothetical protein
MPTIPALASARVLPIWAHLTVAALAVLLPLWCLLGIGAWIYVRETRADFERRR